MADTEEEEEKALDNIETANEQEEAAHEQKADALRDLAAVEDDKAKEVPKETP